MHTINEACILVIRDTMRWINDNYKRPGWMVQNFNGVFLFHCIHLKRTEEFKGWRSQRFLKTRGLSHNFDGQSFSAVRFSYPEAHSGAIEQVNTCLNRALQNPTYWEGLDWRPEVAVLPTIITPNPVFGTFPTLENFKFTPKEERILVTV